MHEMSIYMRLLLIVSMHARGRVYACPFKVLVVVGARADGADFTSEAAQPVREAENRDEQKEGEVGRKAVSEKEEFDSRQQMPN